MPRDRRIRFAFAIVAGPNAGLSCAGWRAWTHGDDIYVTTKELGNKWKVSLHGDAAWRLAVTRENAEADDSVLPPGLDRAPWTFTPPPYVDGHRLAFAIAVPRSALRAEPADPTETVIEVDDRWDRAGIAYLRMTRPGVELADQHRASLVDQPLDLANGCRLWVTSGQERIDPIAPHPPPVGSMIEPIIPAVAGASPGLLVRAVHVG